jgi:ketosteroid isomerase-like protein
MTMEKETSEVIRRFNEAFHRHDGDALLDLIAEDCVLENSGPAPDGARYAGRDAVFAFWSELANSPSNHFEPEEVFVAGDRAVIRWRFRWGDDANDTVRGVNLTRVRNGLIIESMGYVKG